MNLVDKQLERYRNKYSQTLEPIRVNFRLACSSWPWAKRSDVFTHLMHKYPAKMLPYIPIFFLSSQQLISKDEVVLDPFVGTGTVLLESITHPFLKRNCIGADINPLARLIAKSKTTPISASRLERCASYLIHRIKTFHETPHIPTFTNMDFWFSKKAQVGLSKILCCIEEIEDVDIQDFFLVCLSSTIRAASTADPKIAPPVLLKAENFEKNPKRRKEVEKMIAVKKKANTLEDFQRAVEKNIHRMRALTSIKEATKCTVKAEIVWDDARTLRRGSWKGKGIIDKTNSVPISEESIGLAITSPPYINAQKYLRTVKFELLWLGLANEDELVELDRSFLGTERIFASEFRELHHTKIESVDAIVEDIYEKDKRRAEIVRRYFSDMKIVFKQLHRVLKEEGRLVLVVGNNTICGRVVESYEKLSDIASENGDFEVEMVLVDKIRSRGMITKRHETGGMVLDDWVVVLKKV